MKILIGLIKVFSPEFLGVITAEIVFRAGQTYLLVKSFKRIKNINKIKKISIPFKRNTKISEEIFSDAIDASTDAF